jgi:hypothetical protein
MLAAQATNASTHHAYLVSNQNLPAILLMLTRALMKIHKKQHLEPQTIDASKFSVKWMKLANQENALMEIVLIQTSLFPLAIRVQLTLCLMTQRWMIILSTV